MTFGSIVHGKKKMRTIHHDARRISVYTLYSYQSVGGYEMGGSA